MTHLSRPFQVALAAVGLFAAVWLVALRGHSSPSATSSSTPAPQPAAPTSPSTSASPTAPGVAGLTRAIEKARGAVSQSQANAKQLQEKSAQASSPSAAAAAAAAAGTAASSASKSAPSTSQSASHSATASTPAQATRSGSAASTRSSRTGTHARNSTRSHAPSVHTPAAPSRLHAVATPASQQTVEADLKQHNVVAILFWDPHAPLDQVVQHELQAAARSLRGQLAVIAARASQVGSFGAFTRAAQVYGTPTILFVNSHRQTTSLSGLTDVYSLEQAISEAKR